MTVSSTTSSETFACNGITTLFVVPFRALEAASVRGYLITLATGQSTPLVNGVDFTVLGAGDENAIIATAIAYPATYQLHVKRVTPRLQETDYRDNDPFPAESHEACLDRLTHIVQEDAETLSRALLLPDGETAPAMPPKADRANKVWANNSNGDLVFVVPTDGSVGSLALDLANSATPTKGAGQVGFNPALAYAANTIGAAVARGAVMLSWFTGTAEQRLTAAMELAAGRPIDGQGETLTLAAQFSFSQAAWFRNIGFDLPFDGIGLRPNGSLGAPLVATSASGDTITFGSAPGYAAGDLLFVRSADAWYAGGVTSQWARVKSVAGSTVTLMTPLDYTFTASINVYRPAALLAGVIFEDCQFTGLAADNVQKLVRPEFCLAPRFARCTFRDTGHSGVELLTCHAPAFTDCRFERAFGTGLGYGICYDGGCEQMTATNITGFDTRHLVTMGGSAGVNRIGTFTNLVSLDSRESIIDTHEASDLITFVGVSGSMASSATAPVATLQGSRQRVIGITCSAPSGPVMWQPFSVLADDWCEIEGTLSRFQGASSAYAFTIDNRKTAGSTAYVRVRGGALQSASGGRGVYVQNPSTTDINAVDIDSTVAADGIACRVSASSSGKIRNVSIRGIHRRINTTGETVYIDASAAGGIDNVDVDAQVIGGNYGVRNVGNNATNVRVRTAKVTGFGTAATLGTVTAV